MDPPIDALRNVPPTPLAADSVRSSSLRSESARSAERDAATDVAIGVSFVPHCGAPNRLKRYNDELRWADVGRTPQGNSLATRRFCALHCPRLCSDSPCNSELRHTLATYLRKSPPTALTDTNH